MDNDFAVSVRKLRETGKLLDEAYCVGLVQCLNKSEKSPITRKEIMELPVSSKTKRLMEAAVAAFETGRKVKIIGETTSQDA